MSVSYDKRLGLTTDGKGISPCCLRMHLDAHDKYMYVAKGRIAMRHEPKGTGTYIVCCPYCGAVAPGGEQ